MLIKQMNQENVNFVIIGIFKIKTLNMDHIFVMVIMIYHKNQQILKMLLLFILKKLYTEFIFNIWVNIKQKKFDLTDKTGSINCNY